MKKLIFLLILTIIFIDLEIAYSSKVYNKGNNYQSDSLASIDNKLQEINTTYWTNLDILLLWQDSMGCFRATNYIECSINNYNIEGSYLWAINIGIKEDTGKGDVNSWMSSNVNNTREIISELNMKNFQEESLSYLKDEDVIWATNNFVALFWGYMSDKCNNMKQRGSKLWIDINNCKLTEFSEKLPLIEQQEKIIRDKENAVTIAKLAKEKEEERIALEKRRIELEKERKILLEKTITVVKNLFWLVFLLAIISYIIRSIMGWINKKKLYKSISNLASDLNDYKVFVKNEELLLEDDKSYILSELTSLIDAVEITLWNKLVTKDNLSGYLSKKIRIAKEVELKKIKEKDLSSINDKLDKVKKHNL